MQDRQRFIEIMGTTGVCFGEEISPILVDVFWTLLKPYADDDVASAFTIAMKTLKFMPKPAEIIAILDGPSTSKSYEAWNCLIAAMGHVGAYRSVDFEDKTIHAVVEAWGGWMEVCRITTDELRFKAREFKELYNSYQTRPIDIPKLIGRVEAENTQSGFPEWIEEPVKVGFKGGRILLENKYQPPLQLTQGRGPEDEEEVTPDDWDTLCEAGGEPGARAKNRDGKRIRKPGEVDRGRPDP